MLYFDRLDHMDVSSVMMYPYLPGPVPLPETRQNWDPGRLRVEPLFKSSFGSNEENVRGNLVPVMFLGQTIKFQRRLGAAAALGKAGQELEAEAARDPALAKFLAPFFTKKTDLRFYGFYWRNVKGTTRLSSHSFGTAIDLLVDTPYQYWLWDEQKIHPEKAAQGENAYRDDHYIPAGAPQFNAKVVEIMERNGFVWGGKWNHYDTMHFEYRPEFFAGLEINCAGEQPSPIVGLLSMPEEEVADFGPEIADH